MANVRSSLHWVLRRPQSPPPSASGDIWRWVFKPRHAQQVTIREILFRGMYKGMFRKMR